MPPCCCILCYTCLESKSVNAKYEKLGELSVTLEDIQRFRQFESKCPGHPEYRWTFRCRNDHWPSWQGIATSVGMAIAERWLASKYNKPGFELFNYQVYALCGDGDLMEGISMSSFPGGHLKLSNLCWIYDNNKITIEGQTNLAVSDDVATRFIVLGGMSPVSVTPMISTWFHEHFIPFTPPKIGPR